MSEIHGSIVQLTKMLKNLDAWLVKADETATSRSFETKVLLESRLAPDMFPLMRQIQSSCDGVKFLAARLAGKEAPKHPDTEQTLDEIRARIQAVIAFVEGFSASDFKDGASRPVALPFIPGKGLQGSDYLNEMALPNTYFHLTMAYAILRHNGVPIGKTDYIGSLNLRDV